MMKPDKIFECSCADGFTGDFCQFKTEQDHLLFVWDNDPFVFNADGRLIENAVIDEQAGAYGSCSTMLNGEAIIFGGGISNIERQVFRWFLIVRWIVLETYHLIFDKEPAEHL